MDSKKTVIEEYQFGLQSLETLLDTRQKNDTPGVKFYIQE